MMWLKANMQINKVDLKTNKVPLMIIILPNDVDGDDRVDGRYDGGGGRDDGGRRYFPILFSFFSLLVYLFP